MRKRTVAVDVLFGMKGPRTLMVTPATDPAMRDAAHGLLAADGQPVVVINDSPGFVAQRVVAMIVNIGCGVAQRAIATPADIDKGTKLGLGYPFGPLEWGDRLGAGARPASSWSACTPSTASRATGRAPGSSAASCSACRCRRPRAAPSVPIAKFFSLCGELGTNFAI